jgi:hypothetical protein
LKTADRRWLGYNARFTGGAQDPYEFRAELAYDGLEHPDGHRSLRWVYRKLRNGQPWYLRGLDVFTVREGRVAAKLAYVKG